MGLENRIVYDIVDVVDENKQIVIDELINNENEENERKIDDEQNNIEEKSQEKVTVEALAEAPMPAREDNEK